jgi:hypothetical protein
MKYKKQALEDNESTLIIQKEMKEPFSLGGTWKINLECLQENALDKLGGFKICGCIFGHVPCLLR